MLFFLVMITQERVLQIVRDRGPMIPVEIKKILGEGDTFVIGAFLSELASKQKIIVSKLKMGGTPFYYFPGQEYKLQNVTKYMNDKDRQAYDLLRKEIVLRDKELTPLMRVSLRTIQDFAKPLEADIHGQKEIFWKWYLSSSQDAENVVREIIEKEKPVVQVAEPTLQKQEPQVIITPIKKIEPEIIRTAAKPELPAEKKLVREKPRKPAEEPDNAVSEIEVTSDFLERIQKCFRKNEIQIIETFIIKKNSEIDFIIELPSVVGTLKYYCTARAKKKSNDKDLSAAYVKGEMKKLPILYLTTGDVTKRAEEMLKHEFRNIKVKKM